MELLVYKFWKQKHAIRIYLTIEKRKQATATVFRYSKAKRQLRATIIQLKIQPKCTTDVFRDGNKSSKLLPIQLRISKDRERYCWFLWKKTQKKVEPTFFEVKNQQYRYAMRIDRFNCLKKPMINLEVKMRQERYK